MITCRNSVRFSVLRPELYGRWWVIEQVFSRFGVACIITCGTNGHPEDDPHPHGFAQDFATHHIPADKLKPIHETLVSELGPEYTVLYNDKNLKEAVYVDTPNAHFHIQLRKALWREIVAKEKL